MYDVEVGPHVVFGLKDGPYEGATHIVHIFNEVRVSAVWDAVIVHAMDPVVVPISGTPHARENVNFVPLSL